METTIVAEKKETPAVATGTPNTANENTSVGVKVEPQQQAQSSTPPVAEPATGVNESSTAPINNESSLAPAQVAPLVINEEKLKAEEKIKVKSKTAFAHIALMEANGLKQEKLPTELKMKINAWAMGVRKYEKQPTPKLMEMNKKGSVAIADAIQNWIEKDLPEKSEAQVLAEQKEKDEQLRKENERKQLEEKEKQKNLALENQRKESERKQREELERKQRELKQKQDAIISAKNSKEGRVASILKEKGKIRYSELVEILGQEVGESVQVGSIKLLNMFLTNNYKQVD